MDDGQVATFRSWVTHSFIVVVVVVGGAMSERQPATNGWTEHEKQRVGGAGIRGLAFTVRQDEDGYIPRNTREHMGDPGHIRYYFKDTQVAFTPVEADAENAYPIQPDGAVAFSWAHSRINCDIPPGRYDVVEDDGIFIVDFSEGPRDD